MRRAGQGSESDFDRVSNHCSKTKYAPGAFGPVRGSTHSVSTNHHPAPSTSMAPAAAPLAFLIQYIQPMTIPQTITADTGKA